MIVRSVKTFWVYMLRCADDSYYIGVTSNIEQRIAQHHYGTYRSCYTFTRRPLELVFAEESNTPEQAFFVEKRLKGWSRAKKSALARKDWPEIQRLARSWRGHPSTGSG